VNHAPVNLKAGEQLEVSHQSLNAQPFVPILELEDGTKLTQSLAIMDYLDIGLVAVLTLWKSRLKNRILNTFSQMRRHSSNAVSYLRYIMQIDLA